MAVERRTNCPRCGESIRLSREELADKRGFCALCDARFDLLPEMLVGEGPLRSLEHVQAADMAKPPTRHMKEIAVAGEPPRYLLGQAGPRWPYAIMMTFFGMWLVGFLGSPMPAFALLPGLILLFLTAFGLTAHEEISFDRTHLVQRRSPLGALREKRVPIDAIEGFLV